MYLQNKFRKIIKQTFSLMTFSENGIAAYLYFTRSYYDVIVTWRHSECCLYIYTDVTIDCLKLWMTIRESVASLSVWLKMTRFHFSNRLTKKLKKPSSKKGSKVPSNVPSTSAEAGGTEEVMSNMVLKTVDSDTKKSCSSSSSCSSFDVASDITQGSVERIFQVKSFNILYIIHYITFIQKKTASHEKLHAPSQRIQTVPQFSITIRAFISLFSGSGWPP